MKNNIEFLKIAENKLEQIFWPYVQGLSSAIQKYRTVSRKNTIGLESYKNTIGSRKNTIGLIDHWSTALHKQDVYYNEDHTTFLSQRPRTRRTIRIFTC